MRGAEADDAAATNDHAPRMTHDDQYPAKPNGPLEDMGELSRLAMSGCFDVVVSTVARRHGAASHLRKEKNQSLKENLTALSRRVLTARGGKQCVRR